MGKRDNICGKLDRCFIFRWQPVVLTTWFSPKLVCFVQISNSIVKTPKENGGKTIVCFEEDVFTFDLRPVVMAAALVVDSCYCSAARFGTDEQHTKVSLSLSSPFSQLTRFIDSCRVV
jgi:hypothetical protein